MDVLMQDYLDALTAYGWDDPRTQEALRAWGAANPEKVAAQSSGYVGEVQSNLGLTETDFLLGDYSNAVVAYGWDDPRTQAALMAWDQASKRPPEQPAPGRMEALVEKTFDDMTYAINAYGPDDPRALEAGRLFTVVSEGVYTAPAPVIVQPTPTPPPVIPPPPVIVQPTPTPLPVTPIVSTPVAPAVPQLPTPVTPVTPVTPLTPITPVVTQPQGASNLALYGLGALALLLALRR